MRIKLGKTWYINRKFPFLHWFESYFEEGRPVSLKEYEKLLSKVRKQHNIK